MMEFRVASERFWHDINDSFGVRGGIYFLVCVGEDGNPQPVGRLLAEDPGGVLYIGMASSFLDRVIELKKSLSPGHMSKGHECGSRHKSHALISQQYPYERLWVRFLETDSPRAAEQEALEKYIAEFGELPPLNRAG